jgi:hypothetical protein
MGRVIHNLISVLFSIGSVRIYLEGTEKKYTAASSFLNPIDKAVLNFS